LRPRYGGMCSFHRFENLLTTPQKTSKAGLPLKFEHDPSFSNLRTATQAI
jgi:hypothetical protein